jgi:hypothetical protein
MRPSKFAFSVLALVASTLGGCAASSDPSDDANGGAAVTASNAAAESAQTALKAILQDPSKVAAAGPPVAVIAGKQQTLYIYAVPAATPAPVSSDDLSTSSTEVIAISVSGTMIYINLTTGGMASALASDDDLAALHADLAGATATVPSAQPAVPGPSTQTLRPQGLMTAPMELAIKTALAALESAAALAKTAPKVDMAPVEGALADAYAKAQAALSALPQTADVVAATSDSSVSGIGGVTQLATKTGGAPKVVATASAKIVGERADVPGLGDGLLKWMKEIVSSNPKGPGTVTLGMGAEQVMTSGVDKGVWCYGCVEDDVPALMKLLPDTGTWIRDVPSTMRNPPPPALDGYRQIFVTSASEANMAMNRLANRGPAVIDNLMVTQNDLDAQAIVGQAETLILSIDNIAGWTLKADDMIGWVPIFGKVLDALERGVPRSDYTVYVLRDSTQSLYTQQILDSLDKAITSYMSKVRPAANKPSIEAQTEALRHLAVRVVTR